VTASATLEPTPVGPPSVESDKTGYARVRW
jgi:hypothetical protein